jgi:Holliday junction resolvase RusA-like endonuclease
MTYTAEAEHYRKQFREFIRTTLFVEVQKFRKKHTTSKTYTLTIMFFFRPEDILNQGWLKKQAKTPYKKMDVGNRRKLLEDCFAESLDIDDSLFFGVELYKFVGGESRVELILEETDPRTFGIPSTYSGRVL